MISQGDEQAFATVFDHYRNRIYGVALKLTHSTTVAEEIAEDVFLKIWTRRVTLNEIESFSAYLFTIARNETYKILKQIAKNYKIVLLSENNESLIHNNAEDYLIDKEFTSLLQKAIDRLPHQQKQVYKLMKEEDLKRGEVAELLQLQPETVKFHLAQAMKNIRNYCMLHLNTLIGLTILLSAIFEIIK
ncbi:MAG TPA: RNA polymerase sigma-70 factor [Hanamia sp.]|nr:RNA polymerase sigma-70 factor [Hanamia sp.]